MTHGFLGYSLSGRASLIRENSLLHMTFSETSRLFESLGCTEPKSSFLKLLLLVLFGVLGHME